MRLTRGPIIPVFLLSCQAFLRTHDVSRCGTHYAGIPGASVRRTHLSAIPPCLIRRVAIGLPPGWMFASGRAFRLGYFVKVGCVTRIRRINTCLVPVATRDMIFELMKEDNVKTRVFSNVHAPENTGHLGPSLGS